MKSVRTILPLLGLAMLTLPGCLKTQEGPDPRNVVLGETAGPRSTNESPPLSPRPGAECLVDAFGIPRKVLVTERGVRCRSSLPDSALTVEPVRFFFPLFLFGEDQQGYCIGTSPQRDSIVGWVSNRVAVPWSTRLGAEYVPGYPLLIYKNADDLVDLIKTGSTRARPLARATPSGTRKWMPWPIAESRLVEHNGKTYELVRLLFLGEYREGGDLAQGNKPPEGSPIPYTQAEVEQVRKGVRKLVLVFVVDNTASTTPFVAAIVEAVQRIARELKQSPIQPDITFGLVLYRDYVKNILFHEADGGASVVKVFPFQSDLQAFLRTVAPLKAATASSEDTPEAVYDGLDAGLTRLDWGSDGLNERVLILIGDAPGHEPGHPKNPRNLSSDHIINLARQNNVRIFSLGIKGERLCWLSRGE